MTQPRDANDFLMGGGIPSCTFPAIGTTWQGMITRKPEIRQQTDFDTNKPLFWDDGRPKEQLLVIIQCDLKALGLPPANDLDDGERTLYIKGQMQKAIRDAVRLAGARGLEIGGELAVRYVGDVPPPPGKRGLPSKEYAAKYVPPAAGNDFLMTSTAAPASGMASVRQAASDNSAILRAARNADEARSSQSPVAPDLAW